MKTQGTKLVDPATETRQIQWLVLPTRSCPTPEVERRVILSHFRQPHEEWPPARAFAMPVEVRRSRSRVLFCQESGIAL
jgi:hypothetical protein